VPQNTEEDGMQRSVSTKSIKNKPQEDKSKVKNIYHKPSRKRNIQSFIVIKAAAVTGKDNS
jgi:hypothetical protein